MTDAEATAMRAEDLDCHRRIQRIRLSLPVAVLPVRSVHFGDPDAGRGQVPGQARTVAAGALDTDQADGAEPAKPVPRPRRARRPRAWAGGTAGRGRAGGGSAAATAGYGSLEGPVAAFRS